MKVDNIGMSLDTTSGSEWAPDAPSTPEATMPAWLKTIDEEREFYGACGWAVNALPTVAEGVALLSGEIRRLRQVPRDWRMREVMTNIWLLACGISSSIDDWLSGERYDFSKARAIPLAGRFAKPIEKGLARWASRRVLNQQKTLHWRGEWESAIATYCLCLVRELSEVEEDPVSATLQFECLLAHRLPPEALRRRIRIPAAFRSQDLTVYDLLSLADKLAAEVKDPSRPILIVGCRSAGSYFAPILRACLKVRGWENVDSTTIRPTIGTSSWEERKLSAIARRSGLAVIADEPIATGVTLIKAIRLVQRAKIAKTNIIALLPIHPNTRDLYTSPDGPALNSIKIVRLEPEERHKNHVLKADNAERVLKTYFEHNNEYVESVIEDGRSAWLEGLSEAKYHSRLKRLYEVRVRKHDGSRATRYILAKSVGSGWLGYHAFLAGDRLSRYVTPVLGLRDGILYTEWLSQPTQDAGEVETALRERIPRIAGQYIAARAAYLKLPIDSPTLPQTVDHKALTELAAVLSKAYGWKGVAYLQRERLLRELRLRRCPIPTLIDGKMRPQEWIASGLEIRKSDFEHHGQGKIELNASDPAYDLADTILTWDLSRDEERELIRHYAAASGDDAVEARLFHNKLLAGNWSKVRAIDNLVEPRLIDRHEEFDHQFARAFDFLTEHTARYCADFCGRPKTLSWKAPLVVLDVDGVVDKWVFGYPSNTAAGILAISLLHAHGYSIAFNSARSLRQMKLYADYYGGLGVVAEYGSIVWDSISGQQRVLVSDESLRQLESLKLALRDIPGVFLNTDYQYSIRAHVYERGSTAALPETLTRDMMARLGTDRVQLIQTITETTLVARETNKGTGLSELLALAGHPDLETVVIGDSAPDLSMFRVAGRSYAPGQIRCRSAAEMLGCRIASRNYQLGFLESVRAIVHPDGRRCKKCTAAAAELKPQKDLFVRLLRIADKPTWFKLLTAVLDPSAIKAFKTNS
jgi:hydroxymethylpyrimidine pyrophosphatase-like HAD family hydrolase